MREYESFAVIICVTSSEKNAVDRMFDWKQLNIEGEEQQMLYTEIMRDGEKLKIICARQDEMGMCAAAALSTKMIEYFKPQYIIMPGIAAGTGYFDSNDQFYGDVIVANTVWDYSNGKYVNPDKADIRMGKVGFIPRPRVIHINDELIEILNNAIEHTDNECQVHFGSLATGTTVVANNDIVELHIRSQYENTVGLDMEAYGVVYSAEHAANPKPYPIIAKSICDFANEKKDDNYQQFAAFTSCAFVKLLCETCLPNRVAPNRVDKGDE